MRNKKIFDEKFLEYLSNFKFNCDVWSVKEGTPVFPNEPLIIVRGSVIEAQIIETMLLLSVNFQSLIATKANRVVRASEGRSVMEFGSRRAQSYDAAVLGSRACYIGGCNSTACVMADRDFNIPCIGTMAHSWVQIFESEFDAFKNYAELYPDNCTLLVDTYNVVKSGIPNAIRICKEILEPTGHKLKAVRIDSGDISYLSKKCRELLDAAGCEYVKITVSNSLDEYIIRDLLIQDAKIDSFGVGEKMITSKSEPVFGGVYKLVAVENNGNYEPKIKLSETVEKITNPYFKNLYRIFSKDTGNAIADYVTAFDENIDEIQQLVLFDPNAVWKKKKVKNFRAESLLHPIFVKGKLVYESPKLEDIQKYCKEQISFLWDEVKRFEYPHKYNVNLSTELYQIKNKLLEQESL